MCVLIGLVVLFRVYINVKVYPNDKTLNVLIGSIGSSLLNTISTVIMQWVWPQVIQLPQTLTIYTVNPRGVPHGVIFRHQLLPHGVILKFRGFSDSRITPWGNDRNLVNNPMGQYSNQPKITLNKKTQTCGYQKTVFMCIYRASEIFFFGFFAFDVELSF